MSLQFRAYTFFGEEAKVDYYHNRIKIFIYFQSVAGSIEIGGMRKWGLLDHRLSSRRHYIGSGCLTRPQKSREEADYRIVLHLVCSAACESEPFVLMKGRYL